MRGIQSSLRQIEEAGIRVVAISVDAPEVSRDLREQAGLTYSFLSDPQAEVIRKPGGSSLVTQVRGVEMSNPSRLDGKEGLLIGDASLSKDDVAQGTEVYVTRPA